MKYVDVPDGVGMDAGCKAVVTDPEGNSHRVHRGRRRGAAPDRPGSHETQRGCDVHQPDVTTSFAGLSHRSPGNLEPAALLAGHPEGEPRGTPRRGIS